MGLLQTKRRAFLSVLAGLPGMRLLAHGRPAVAQERTMGRDVIQELGIRSFIVATP